MKEKFLLFEYDKQGYHKGGVDVSDTLETVFQTVVKVAQQEKRKVIITDADDMCVFHMEDGEVIWPKHGA